MHLEMIGPTTVPMHSDAQCITHLIYKWNHPKRQIAEILIDKYNDILKTGWVIDKCEIERDIADLFHHNFWRFVESSKR